MQAELRERQKSPIDFWTKAEARENQTKRKDTARFAKEYNGTSHEIPKGNAENLRERSKDFGKR